MNSIAESVHQLLSEQIELLGLSEFYEVQKSRILGINGSEFVFAGIRQMNVAQIKSYESIDVCWVEEAQACTKTSWQTLIPTIRKEGSEIWVSMNPILQSDDSYQRFILKTPPGAVVQRVTYRDNPWFPEVLRDEMEYLRETDPDAYAHVWEGECIRTVEGAIYAKELSAAEQGQRITRVPYDPMHPVTTFWDLGYGDSTAIWFAQALPYEYRLIDYLEGHQLALKHYLDVIQRKHYTYREHVLPHDAKAHGLGTGRSIQEMMVSNGFNVRVLPRLDIADRLNAARSIFPMCWFDGENCADGLQALRHYKWAPLGLQGQIKAEPLHDWASNGADAFGYFALGIKLPQQSRPVTQETRRYVSAWS